jgi:hypothetical protein
VRQRVQLWSLESILYEVITKQLPANRTLSRTVSDISSQLSDRFNYRISLCWWWIAVGHLRLWAKQDPIAVA